MSRSTTQKNSALIPSDATPCDVATDPKALKALKNVGIKYKHAIPDRIWRLGSHLMVVIRCQHPGCETERLVATSDVFQTKTCIEHRKGSAAPTTKRAKTARVSSK